MSRAIVIPTSGRPSLRPLLEALRGEHVVVIEDRDRRGPAWARNAGWRSSDADWIVFLDDDVLPAPGWREALDADLASDADGSQGRVLVPVGSRPTDWERHVAGLAGARWATADMAYRREALAAVGGFDERFPRAFREDADIALWMLAAGRRLERGSRCIVHPVGPAGPAVSVIKQAGNADDALMRALHGSGWRSRAGVPRGRRRRHAAIVAAAVTAVGAAAFGRLAEAGRNRAAWPGATCRRLAEARRNRAAWPGATRRRLAEARRNRAAWPGATRRRLADARRNRAAWPGATRRALAAPARRGTFARRLARLSTAIWTAGTLELAWARIAPGPRTAREVFTMGWTSALLPFAATGWWLRGLAGLPRALAAPGPRGWPAAVLFDRDSTLIADVPYNADPALVTPMPGAAEALARLRGAGVPTAVVSNQSGIARGLVRHGDVRAIHRRMEAMLGPLGPLEYCEHGPGDGCACRKPEPGLILRAAARLGVRPQDCAVVGDIGADIEAARAAGARALLVPTPRTRAEEVAAAPERARDLRAAVALLLGDAVAAPGTRTSPHAVTTTREAA
jgi:histidinol-phosphate phosphatase family protein